LNRKDTKGAKKIDLCVLCALAVEKMGSIYRFLNIVLSLSVKPGSTSPPSNTPSLQDRCRKAVTQAW
jgi:hypothetical protein